MWKSEQAAETTALPETVWRVLSDTEGWPTWNPGLSRAHLEGPLAEGTVGSVTLANGMERQFHIVEVSDETFFAYGSKEAGARQRFLQRVEALGDGRTRVTLGHTIEGPMSLVYGLLFGRIIRGYLPTAVRQLVAKAEQAS